MSIFRKVSKFFRDKKRDELCAHLQSLGIDAQLAPRDRKEENLTTGPPASYILVDSPNSLGLIDISQGPIRWVNVRKFRSGSGNLNRGISGIAA